MRHIVAAVRDGDFVGDCLSAAAEVAAMATIAKRGADVSEVQRLRTDLAVLRQVPRDQARALPQPSIHRANTSSFEREALFRTQWICLGHIGAIPNVGDYFTAELVDEQLLIVRDTVATVRVLSNVCRHRGSPVATLSAGHAARFVCGYHGWTYALDGRLLAAPLIKDGEHSARRHAGCRNLPAKFGRATYSSISTGAAPPLGAALSPDRTLHPQLPSVGAAFSL